MAVSAPQEAPPSAASPPQAPPSAPATPLGWTVLAGWQLGWAGPQHVAQALDLQAALSVGSFELGVNGAFGLPATLGASPVSARVSRHVLRATWLARVRLSAAWTLLGGGHAGILWFSRTTRLSDPGLSRTPDDSLTSAAFGADVALRWQPLAHFGLELGSWVSVVTAPPRYALQRSSGQSERAHESWLEPSSRLSLVFSQRPDRPCRRHLENETSADGTSDAGARAARDLESPRPARRPRGKRMSPRPASVRLCPEV